MSAAKPARRRKSPSREAQEVAHRVNKLPGTVQRELARIAERGSARRRRAASIDQLERKAKRAYVRYAAATDAILAHPQTIARKAIEATREAEPEFASVIDGILKGLRHAEDVAITVCGSLENHATTESKAAAYTLMGGCANALNEQIEELERAMQHARISGSRMVIAKEINSDPSEVQS